MRPRTADAQGPAQGSERVGVGPDKEHRGHCERVLPDDLMELGRPTLVKAEETLAARRAEERRRSSQHEMIIPRPEVIME